MSWKEECVKYLQNIPRWLLLFTIVSVSAILLFSSDSFLSKIFLLEIRNKYGCILGIVFLISSVLSLGFMFRWIKRKISKIIRERNIVMSLIGENNFLSQKECSILYELYGKRDGVGILDYSNPLVSNLIKSGFIIMPYKAVVQPNLKGEMPIRLSLSSYSRRLFNKTECKLIKRIINLEKKKQRLGTDQYDSEIKEMKSLVEFLVENRN